MTVDSPERRAGGTDGDARVWRYRAHLRWAPWLFAAVTAAIVCFAGGTAVLELYAGRPLGRAAHRLQFPLIIAAETAFFTWWSRRFALVRVWFTGEGIRYQNARGVIEVPIDEINALGFSHARKLGGWIKIRAHHDTIRLTVVLEDLSEFLRTLHARLEQRPERLDYDRHRFASFFQTAAAIDFSWQRAYRMTPYLLTWAVLAVSAAYGISHAGRFAGWVRFPFFMVSLLWAPLAWTVMEMRAVTLDARDVDRASLRSPGRDFERERRIYWFGAAIAVALWGALAAVFWSYR